MQQPEAAEDWRELVPVVDDCIAELPEDDRELLVKHYFAGRTQADLAVEGGVSQQAIAKRLQRIVDTLRQGLRGKGVTVSAAILGTFLTEDAVSAAVPTALTESLCKIGLAGVSEAPGVADAAHRSSASTVPLSAGRGVRNVFSRKTATVLGVVVVLSGLFAARRWAGARDGDTPRAAIPVRPDQAQGTGGHAAEGESGSVLPKLRNRRPARPDAAGGSGTDAELAEVLHCLKTRQEKVQSLKISWTTTKVYPRGSLAVGEPLRGFGQQPEEDTTVSTSFTVSIGPGGKRCDRSGPVWNSYLVRFKHSDTSASLYDGHVRELDRTQRLGRLTARNYVPGLTGAESRALFLAYWPSDSVTQVRIFGSNVERRVPPDSTVLVGHVELDGHPCAILDVTKEWRPSYRPTDRYWLAVDQDYLIVRHERSSRGTVQEWYRLRYSPHAALGWCLVSWERSRLVAAATNCPMSYTSLVSESQINRPLAPEDFRLDFPPGTRVEDEVTGSKYTAE